MANSLYINTIEPGSGKALVALGILELVLRKTTKVGFFRPITRGHPQDPHNDEDIELILTYFGLEQTYEESYGLCDREARDLIGQQKNSASLERIIAKYKALEQKCDFILCEGSDYLGEGSAFEFDINREIAKNLGCPILLLANADRRSLEEALSPIQTALEAYSDKGCRVTGIILNKAAPHLVGDLEAAMRDRYGDSDLVLSVIPFYKKLSSPRVAEIVRQLGAEVLYGHRRLNALVPHYLVAAMQIQHALTWLEEGSAIVTPSDRGDIIIGMLQAHQSANYPTLSSIILSGGLSLAPSIAKLVDGLPDPLPILTVATDTYTTASQIKEVRTSVTSSDSEKIALSIEAFDTWVNLPALEERMLAIVPVGMTPKMFTYNLVQHAKLQKRHIVLPEGKDPRILQASSVLLSQDIVNLTLLGKKSRIERTIKQYGIQLDLDAVRVIDPAKGDKFAEYAEVFCELRKHKGMTPEAARDYLMDVSYFGTMMVYSGDADGMVSGAAHTTQHTIRPALQIIKTKPGFSIVSSVFFMCLDDRVLVYGDCAVNPNPRAEELADIAIASAETAQTFGIIPKVALLSYSSGESGKGEEVEKVREAAKIARSRRPDLALEGPIQYDAAVDAKVAAQKMPDSPVAGQASVLIFPDLNTGNNTYKAVQRETGAIAIGPVLQGLKKPVNDLSRGCTVDDIINTVVITAIQTQSISPR
ncbi:MAG: phosphate acetyltransferase [Spirulina sp.]